MRYTLSTSEENILKAQKLPKSRQSLSNHRLYKSASKWGSKHLRCLRVQHLDDLPFERFFDGQIPISDNDEYFAKMAKHISMPSLDDICHHGPSSSSNENPFSTFYDRLAECLAYRSQSPERDLVDTSGSDSSSSGGDDEDPAREDKSEMAPRSMLQSLFEVLLRNKDITVINHRRKLVLNGNDMRTKNWLGHNKQPLNANNDGGIVVLKSRGKRKRPVYTRTPALSFEAKRRHAGGRVHHEGQAEAPNDSLLGQEFANLLGRAMSNSQKRHKKWMDQDAWMFTVHGTEVRLVTTFFSKEYLAAANSRIMPPRLRAVIFRSKPLDMRSANDRKLALKVCIASLFVVKPVAV